MNQLGIPTKITPEEVSRQRSLGESIDLCAKAAGLTPKEVQDALHADRAQYSRWTDGKEGIAWSKLVALMDLCGNDAPLLWMLRARGYDIASLRRQESELETQLRMAREEIDRMRLERQSERNLLQDVLARGRVA